MFSFSEVDFELLILTAITSSTSSILFPPFIFLAFSFAIFCISLIVEEIKVGKKVGALKFKASNKENQQKVIVSKNRNSPSKSNVSGFNNFEGRNYTDEDWSKMQNKLLGWDNDD